jgi:hypothetical protein
MRRTLMFFGLAAAAWGADLPVVDPRAVVELPPMLVEAAGTSPPRWLYGRMPGFEVLSCASAEVTEDLTLRLYRLRVELGELVPASLPVQRDEPFTIILYPQSRAQSLSQALNEHLDRGQGQNLPAGRLHPPPNLDLDDPDSDLLFSVVDDHSTKLAWSPGSFYTGGSRYDGIVFSPEYIGRLFSDRVPALPPWFIYGMARFYGAISHTDDGLEFAPDDWLSPESATAARRDGADAFRATLPLSELFRGQPPAPPADAAARERAKLWLAESVLFVRWSIDSPAHRQYQARAALWKFAEAASHAPVTEELFRQCFGMGYSDARDEMSDYLARAVHRSVEVDLDSDPPLPKLRLSDAAPADLHRIKGDFARRTLRLVRESHPALLPIYVGQAREVLQGAYDDGERDPRLVADLGLLCREAGSLAEARRYLEEGFRSGTMRPSALAELARLRLAPYLAAAREGSRRPPATQVESILAPIRAARRLQPPQLLTYVVVASLCGLDPARVTPEERALLAEGADYFPSATLLVLAAVRQEGAGGDRTRALRLADLGLWTGTDPGLLAQLESARNALRAKPTK